MAKRKMKETLDEIIGRVVKIANDLSLNRTKDEENVLSKLEDISGRIKELSVDVVDGDNVKKDDVAGSSHKKDNIIDKIKDPSDRNYIIKLRTIIYVQLFPDSDIESIQKYGSEEYKSNSDLNKWEKELQSLPRDKKDDLIEKFVYYRFLEAQELGYLVSMDEFEDWIYETYNIFKEETKSPRDMRRWIKTFRKKYNIRSTIKGVKLEEGLFIRENTFSLNKK